jgi:hypothetical protein
MKMAPNKKDKDDDDKKSGKYSNYNRPSEKEIRETVKELQEKAYGKPDSSENFSRAGHQARNDAEGTDFQVRERKNDVVSVEKEPKQKK